MSSLAGALDAHDAYDPSSSPKSEDDMDPVQPQFDRHHFPQQDVKEEMDDLFGEDEDVNMVQHEAASSPASDPPDHEGRLSSPERRHREQLEYAEDDEPEPVVEHRLEADVAIPNIPVPRSSDGNYWVIRMPNFIKLDSKPFHPDTYIGPEQEEEDAHHAESLREKSMSIKLKVENTVRWRWSKDEFGQDRKQSNSRIVRWSDGSLSLQLGRELFDISQSIDTSGAVSRQALGSNGALLSQSQSSLSQSQSQGAISGAGHAQGLTYLVAQHKRAEILQCEAVITGYMSLRPTGMQSETHRMLVRAVGQKHSRVARLRMVPEPKMDPEREKLELAKAAARKPRKSRGGAAGDDDGFAGTRRRRQSYTRKRTGDDMWSDDEEDDDTGFGKGGSEDEYGDDTAARKGKRKHLDDENGRKGPGEYQTDDFLVADSDEDDEFGGGESNRRKRKRSAREEEEAGEDDLERLEAKISQNEAEQRKRRQRDVSGGQVAEDLDDGADAAGEDAMDVESEDEDDFGVRRGRGTSGGRKRRAVGVEEEEEEED
ncbi:Leo1-domain-containing protein [Ganoderma leucocontextum]|nr:Leo1-domain-containing protein [Ganoderma leucocontextum]